MLNVEGRLEPVVVIVVIFGPHDVDPRFVGQILAAFDDRFATPGARIPELRGISGDGVFDDFGYFDGIGGLGISSGVELKHAAVVIVIRAGLVWCVDVLGKDRRFGNAWLDDGHPDAKGCKFLR